MLNSVVITPTYNEKEDIENTIHVAFGLGKVFHILVIDDGSPGETATIVKGLQKESPECLFIVERKGKLGLGIAYTRGFEWAIRHKCDLIFEMDADFSHNPNDLPRLCATCTGQGADVVIGSRYCNGMDVANWSSGRVLMSYSTPVYVHVATGMRIQDMTTGLKCYRCEMLEMIDLDRVYFKGYAFQVEIRLTAYKCGLRLVEVPAIFINHVLSVLRTNSSISGEALFGVLQLRW